jgi:hypothetical protein
MTKSGKNKKKRKSKIIVNTSKVLSDEGSQKEEEGFFSRIVIFFKKHKIVVTAIGVLTFITLIFTLKDQIKSTFFKSKQESQAEEILSVIEKSRESDLKSSYLRLKEVIDDITLQIPVAGGVEEVKEYNYTRGQHFLKYVNEKLSGQLTNTYLMENDSLLLRWQSIQNSVKTILNLSVRKYSPSKGLSCDTCFDNDDVALMSPIYYMLYEQSIVDLFEFIRIGRFLLERENRFRN